MRFQFLMIIASIWTQNTFNKQCRTYFTSDPCLYGQVTNNPKYVIMPICYHLHFNAMC
jgi:hypothetical protein